MIYSLKNAAYRVEHNKPVLYFFARDENGNRATFRKIITELDDKPYFYVPVNEQLDGPVFAVTNGKKCRKVIVNTPHDVGLLKPRYTETYESNILFPMRYIIDNNLKDTFSIVNNKIMPSSEPNNIPTKVMVLDTEIHTPTDEVPNEMVAATQMLTIVYQMLDEDEMHVLTASNSSEEKQMLLKFLDMIEKEDPDVIAGWNVAYDINYLLNRMQHLGLKSSRMSPTGSVHSHKMFPHISGRTVFNLLEAFKKYHHGKKFETYSLEFIAAHPEFGVGIPEDNFNYVEHMNPQHLDMIVPYCKRDVERTIGLARRWRLCEHYGEMARFVGCTMDDTLTTTRFLDVYLLREYYGKYVMGKSSAPKDYKIKGGWVMLPKLGVFENVCVFDFSGLYPSIIISENLSPETYSEIETEHTHKVGEWNFRTDIKGILPHLLIELSNYRADIKQKMINTNPKSPEWSWLWIRQYSIKQINAAIYGNFKFYKNRAYTPQISAATTHVGRKLTKRVRKIIEERGYRAIICDTDSIYFEVGKRPKEEVVKIGKELCAELNQMLKKEAGGKVVPELEFEKVYGRLFTCKKIDAKSEEDIAKKRYFGRVIWQNDWCDKIDIKGFEAKRSDSALFTRYAQKELMKTLLHMDVINAKTIKEAVRGLIAKFEEVDIREVGLPVPLGMPPEAYKRQSQILGIFYANRYLGKHFGPGSRSFEYWMKKLPDGKPSKITLYSEGKEKSYDVTRVAFEPTDDIESWKPYIDWDLMKEKVLYRKIRSIIDSTKVVTLDEILTGTKQSRMEDFPHNNL